MTTSHRAPLHPGEVLLEEVVKPLDMSSSKLAEIERRVQPREKTA